MKNLSSSGLINPENIPNPIPASEIGQHLIKGNFAGTNLHQKEFNGPHPVRPYRRFLPVKKANTGISADSTYLNFMNHDIIKPYTNYGRLNLYNSTQPNFEERKNKWSLSPMKECPQQIHLPKVQQYKTYNFVQRDEEKVNKYLNNFLKTDHISLRVPKFLKEKSISKKENEIKTDNKTDNKNDNKTDNKETITTESNKEKKLDFNDIKSEFKKTSFLDMKRQYNVTSESNSWWIPKKYDKTFANRSSVNYNIISFQSNPNQQINSSNILLDKKIINRKKAIAEFTDLTSTSHPKFNQKYQEVIKKNPKTFYTYNGVFTYLYDASFRSGGITKPFQINENIKNKK
jgi:hypothetical protein